jgi:DNA uptake protein ComE-like DNA-binding protein
VLQYFKMALDLLNEEIDFGGKEGKNENGGVGLEDFLDKNKQSILFLLLGLILLGLGVFLFRRGYIGSLDKVEILSNISTTPVEAKTIVVEVSGSVEKPGVYKLSEGARVEDLLIAGGGISADADRTWVEKYINRAAKLTDGQKLYILKTGEQTNNSSANNSGGIKVDQGIFGVSSGTLVNINTASLSELDALPGIGQVYGQSIIEHRPYSDIGELVSRGALKQGVYDKIKDLVTAF